MERFFEGPEWLEFWTGLGLTVESFASLGLTPSSRDDEIWRATQAREVVILTANRNHDGPRSMEAVIRAEGTAESLPVLTVSDTHRFGGDRSYTERLGVALLEYLSAIDEYRGTGRLFVP